MAPVYAVARVLLYFRSRVVLALLHERALAHPAFASAYSEFTFGPMREDASLCARARGFVTQITLPRQEIDAVVEVPAH